MKKLDLVGEILKDRKTYIKQSVVHGLTEIESIDPWVYDYKCPDDMTITSEMIIRICSLLNTK